MTRTLVATGTVRTHTTNVNAPIVLSFDVEEHYRIEAASGLRLDSGFTERSRARLAPTTRWILEELANRSIQATFFVVGEVARDDPGLIRAITAGGHEVASHGWDHRRVLTMTPEGFRADLRMSKDALEQASGGPVVGYRAPTFSITRRNGWAIDILAEEGFLYDSSIVPAHHDRYGIPDAPRGPFLVLGHERELIELPPVTIRLLGANLPIGGGGYFRLLPLWTLLAAVGRLRRETNPCYPVVYFHPWEFDPSQEQLPLKPLSRFRTYVGIRDSRARLARLLSANHFARACDVAQSLANDSGLLPQFSTVG